MGITRNQIITGGKLQMNSSSIHVKKKKGQENNARIIGI
jgi:hypothetical protein